MTPRRRKWADQSWSLGDARWVLGWFALLAFGVVWWPMMVVAFVVLVGWVAFVGVRYVRRERRMNREGPPPFWADKI